MENYFNPQPDPWPNPEVPNPEVPNPDIPVGPSLGICGKREQITCPLCNGNCTVTREIEILCPECTTPATYWQDCWRCGGDRRITTVEVITCTNCNGAGYILV